MFSIEINYQDDTQRDDTSMVVDVNEGRFTLMTSASSCVGMNPGVLIDCHIVWLCCFVGSDAYLCLYSSVIDLMYGF